MDRDLEQEVDDEFAFHVEMRARELEGEGLDPAEARRRATQAFGNRGRAREACLDIQRTIQSRRRSRDSVLGFLADLRIAARSLARRPGFASLAILTLALGIGAVTAIFSLVDATLLRPLPYPDSDRIVTVWETHPAQPIRPVAPANFLDWQARSRSVTDWAAVRLIERTLDSEDRPERIQTGSVTSGFFKTLGIEAQIGRSFSSLEPVSSGPAAVMSHALWQRTFGGDPTVLAQTLYLDGNPYEVIGVAPEGFEYPQGVQLWTWSAPDLPEAPGFPGDLLTLRDARFISTLGRLGPGIDLETAQTEMDGIADALRAEYPVENLDAGVELVGLQEYLVAGFRSTVLLLMVAVGLVLAIACANVANLLLVRAIERRQELALRSALGATGTRLLRYHLAEGLALGLCGAALGIGIAGLLIKAAGRWSWAWGDIALQLDLRAVAVVLAITGVTTVAFSSLPGLLVRWSPTAVLGGRGTAAGGDHRAGRVREMLLAVEVALAFALVLSTGLTVRTVMNLRAVDLGFDAERLATVRVFLEPDPTGGAGLNNTLDEMMRALEADAAVEAVAVAGSGPLATGPWAGLRVEGRDFPPGEHPDAGWQFVSADYFSTYGIPVVRGRSFNASDLNETEPVAVINETLARQVFNGRDPVGERINTGLDGRGVWVRVVGVAGDTHNRGPAESVFPTLYRPMSQGARRAAVIGTRLRVEPDARILSRLEGLVRTASPDSPVTAVESGTQLVGRFSRGTRTTLIVLGALATLALVLSAIGLYGVTSYSVSRRTRDLGVRLALGARPNSIVWLVVAETLRPCLAGLGLGLAASLGVAWWLRSMLFELAPYDPATLAGVATLMIAVTVLASAIPALRAATVDPATTLRE